jgi:hypothetical protein
MMQRGSSDWSWFDPNSQERFTQRQLTVREDASTESRLQNIVRLIDQVFDDVSVFEQYEETRGNGRAGDRATADLSKRMDLPGVRTALARVEHELFELRDALQDKRASFVEQQLSTLGIDETTSGLKIHIGSAGYLMESWLNIDAGGADLALNVNWGLPFQNGSTRFAYCSHLLEHLRYSDQAPVFVREVHRILENGGVVRFVVPDVGKLLTAYALRDKDFYASRQEFYPLVEGFLRDGLATLDYLLLFSGAAPQLLSYNHKFGYDSSTLRKLLIDAGFSSVTESSFQGSKHPELRVDNFSYNTRATHRGGEHYSLFFEATK